jgi:hypothetical protein
MKSRRLFMNRVAANVSSLIFGGDQSRLTSAATRHGSWSQCAAAEPWRLSMDPCMRKAFWSAAASEARRRFRTAYAARSTLKRRRRALPAHSKGLCNEPRFMVPTRGLK